MSIGFVTASKRARYARMAKSKANEQLSSALNQCLSANNRLAVNDFQQKLGIYLIQRLASNGSLAARITFTPNFCF
jgi:hypothetical protein